MDCSPPSSSVHGILQARILEWVVIHFPGIFLTQGLNPGLLHCKYSLKIGKNTDNTASYNTVVGRIGIRAIVTKATVVTKFNVG